MGDPEINRNRVTIVVYLLLLVGALGITGYSARNVIFERFTARNAPLAASAGKWIYIFGGRSSDGDLYRELYAIDLDHSRLRKLGTVPETLSGAALVATADGAYIIGGHTDSGYADTIYFYDRDRGSLKLLGGLPSPRGYGGAAAVGEDIYYAGGFDGDERLSQIVQIDPLTGATRITGNLPEPRDGFAAVAHANRVLLVAGEGPDGREYDTIAELDPETGRTIAEYRVGFDVSRSSALVHQNQLVALTRRHGGGDVVLTLDLAAGPTAYAKFRPIDLETRDVTIASTPHGLLAIGGEHPTISRQIGVWSISANSRDVEPLRIPSRVWN